MAGIGKRVFAGERNADAAGGGKAKLALREMSALLSPARMSPGS